VKEVMIYSVRFAGREKVNVHRGRKDAWGGEDGYGNHDNP